MTCFVVVLEVKSLQTYMDKLGMGHFSFLRAINNQFRKVNEHFKVILDKPRIHGNSILARKHFLGRMS